MSRRTVKNLTELETDESKAEMSMSEKIEESLHSVNESGDFTQPPSTATLMSSIHEDEKSEEIMLGEEFEEEESEIGSETEEEEKQEVDADLLALQSPPSTTFSQLVGKASMIPIRNKPAYRNVLKHVKILLEELVSKNEENVLTHFEEWSLRVINNLSKTLGIPQELLLPNAYHHLHTLKSFTFDWKDAVEEYIHEYGIEILGEGGIMENFLNEMDEGGEDGIQTVDDVEIKDDDYDEGGYKHYLDIKAEPKEPPFDEFEYITLEQLDFFDDVGIGLPRSERYEIHMAMLRLAKVRKLTDVKFWGKLLGLYQDYYIAEAIMKPEDMKIEDFEDLPSYEESEFVGEFCEELLIDELEGETQGIHLEPEVIGEIYGEEYGEQTINEIYGEFNEEIGEETLTMPKQFEIQTPTVTFDDFEKIRQPTFSLTESVGEEIFGEQESVFELEVDDGTFKGKVNLKNYKLPQLPRIKEKVTKVPPVEEPGEGTNKHVFFVTNDPKSDWIRLPHVTPEQIVVARQIRKFFTGYLTSRVNSFPKFPGIEINLLRAQIARISAGTQVSPAGYFRFDEGEEAADAFDIVAGQNGKIVLNRDFDSLTVKDLTDPTCSFWVHHTEHILKQGRTVWYNINHKEPKPMVEGAEDLEDDGEEAPPFEDVIGEKGPPLLTSCAEDLFMESIPPWTVKPAIETSPHEGCVYVRSNLWPGSYSFAFGRKIGFMYIGWGLKNVTHGYTPPPPYLPSSEYPLGPAIIEIADPTPFQEEEYKLKLAEWLRKQEKHVPMNEGEGGEGIEEEEA